ncbi:helix-turn-helix domain-containing protein [Ferruginibacter sp. HRS2-29]|uniref:helix-turn-helix domain-containing protein n=1 Tax=Ferruginibacter sp. HRS2-29 TaxID=2487334 RepID=UPI0020CE8D46|nr:helix-turn-helix domain-containing protein [Ferruginibacter sp. HRS2-29]MCP9752255.1 helix-turn-helix domain-containing protein [Ferruginibacter sp. HRS2-29]
MNRLKQFRLQLTLTQEELAQYLAVSPSVVSMAESGRRKLPDDARIKFEELRYHYNEHLKQYPDKTGFPDADKKRDSAIKKIDQTLRELKILAPAKQRGLTAMTQNYTLASHKFTSLESLKAKLASQANKKEDLSWVNGQIVKCRKQLERYSLAKQIALRIQTEVMYAEIDIFERILSDNKL